MLEVRLDEENRIAVLEPHGALTKEDFETASSTIDPFIEQVGSLRGLVIYTQKFPGWDSLGAMIAHLKFVREHHKEIRRVALVTDSAVGDVAEGLGRHFISAKVTHLGFDDLDKAVTWILEQ